MLFANCAQHQTSGCGQTARTPALFCRRPGPARPTLVSHRHEQPVHGGRRGERTLQTTQETPELSAALTPLTASPREGADTVLPERKSDAREMLHHLKIDERRPGDLGRSIDGLAPCHDITGGRQRLAKIVRACPQREISASEAGHARAHAQAPTNSRHQDERFGTRPPLPVRARSLPSTGFHSLPRSSDSFQSSLMISSLRTGHRLQSATTGSHTGWWALRFTVVSASGKTVQSMCPWETSLRGA